MIPTPHSRAGRRHPMPSSRVMPRSRRLRRSARSGSANGSDQAGSSSVTAPLEDAWLASACGGHDVEDVGEERRLAVGQAAQSGDLVDQPPERRLVVGVEVRRSPRRPAPRPARRSRSRRRSARARCAAGVRVALDARGADGDGRLARRRRPSSSMSRSEKVGEPRLSRTWSTPTVPSSSRSGAAAMERGT